MNVFIKRLLLTAVLAPLVLLITYLNNELFKIFVFFLFLFAYLELIQLKNTIIKFFIFILLITFILSIFQLIQKFNGTGILIYILLVTWLSDTGGYIIGKIFKGKKINIISPNKTFIGFIGSLLCSQLTFIYLIFNDYYIFDTIYISSLFIFFCSFIVIIGDLLFSFFKRKCQIKDYSNILPGHGGIFDRIDGLIILTIVLNIFIK